MESEMLMCRRIVRLSFLLAMVLSPAVRAQESLLIGPGDQLHVLVLDTPELEQHPRVTDSGEIPLVGVGTLKVAGLTPGAAAQKIQDFLISTHFMNHPSVTVTIDQFATQTISVLGQVKLPGVFQITTSRSVLDAIAMAGGLSDTADRHVTIQRKDPTIKPITYDLSNDADKAMTLCLFLARRSPTFWATSIVPVESSCKTITRSLRLCKLCP
jgi:polysaccharide export outer membrane protein